MHGWLKSHSEWKIILVRSLLFKGHPYLYNKFITFQVCISFLFVPVNLSRFLGGKSLFPKFYSTILLYSHCTWYWLNKSKSVWQKKGGFPNGRGRFLQSCWNPFPEMVIVNPYPCDWLELAMLECHSLPCKAHALSPPPHQWCSGFPRMKISRSSHNAFLQFHFSVWSGYQVQDIRVQHLNYGKK